MKYFDNSCGGTVGLFLLLLAIVQPTEQVVYSCSSSASCGCSSNSASITKIVGGETAGTSTWGWAVSLRLGSGGLCGGSILSSQWIITAAHCVISYNASQVTVYAGSNTKWSSGQSRSVSLIVLHPSYNTNTKVNDIALLQLSSPLNMADPNVKVVCIPSISSSILAAGEWPPASVDVVAVGWGTLVESGSTATSLRQVTVRTISYNASMCKKLVYNSQYQFCAGIDCGGKDTCQGDSGGPLMIFTTSNQWLLVGLTSYGTGCARASSPGIYTRVAAYQSWINSVTSSAATNPSSNGYTIANSTITCPSSSNAPSEFVYRMSFSKLFILSLTIFVALSPFY